MEVSVIIPVYNAAPFVEKAVRSALMQEEVREVLVIDDGSTDGSLEIIRRLAIEDKRVRVFQHPGGGNKGPGASRNVGLRHVRYEFIAFLDSDDYYLPDRFSITKATFERHPNAGGVYEAVFLSEPVSYSTQLVTFRKPIPPEECLERFVMADLGYFSIVGLTLRAVILRKLEVTFREDLFLAEDLDFIMELCNRSAFYSGSLDDPVVIVRKHDNNTTAVSYSVHSKYRFLLFSDWVKKILDNRWSRRLNWFFVKSYLSHLPILNRIWEIKILIRSIQAIFLAMLLLKHPKLITRILFP